MRAQRASPSGATVADFDINVKGNAAEGLLKIEGLLTIIAKEAVNAGNKFEGAEKAAEKVGKAETLASLNHLRELVSNAASTSVALVQGLTDAAVAGDRQATALQRLGPAWNDVRDATRGTVTAQEAFSLQQSLLQSGLPTTGRELATITRAARDYAHSMGIDTTQALQQMTEALRNGEAGGLRRFGIAVQQGQTRTQAFESALRQMTAAQNGSAPSAHTAAEAQEALSNSVTAVTQSLALLIAQKTDLFAFFTEFSGWLNDLGDGSRNLASEVENMGRNLVGAQMHQADDGGVARRSAFLTEATGYIQAIHAHGGDTSGYRDLGRLATTLSDGDRQRFLGALRGEANAYATGGDVAGAAVVRRVANVDTTLEAADRTQREQAAAAQAERDRIEAERRRQSARERQAATPMASAAERSAAGLAMFQARLAAQAAGLEDQLGLHGTAPVDSAGHTVDDRQLEALRRSATNITPSLNENSASVMTRQAAAMQAYITAMVERSTREQELRTQLEEANRAEKNLTVQRAMATDALIDSNRRERADTLALAVDRQRAENELAIAEGRTSQVNRQRVSQLADVRTALQGLLAETNARIVQAEAEHRSQQEINELIRERVGLTRSLTQTSAELTQIQRDNSSATRDFADAMGNAGMGALSAFTSAAFAAAEANESLGVAFQRALHEQMVSLSKESVPQVFKNLALAAGAAFTNPPAVPSFLAAAGLWTAVGAVSGGIAAAVPAPAKLPAAASGGGGGGAASARAATLPPGEGSGALTLQINVSGAMFNEGVEEACVRAIDSAHARGITPRFARGLNG